MPIDVEIPNALRGFFFHGVELTPIAGDQANGDCPFCGKPGKFYANAKDGRWDCKSCGEAGGVRMFLEKLWAISDENTQNYDGLATDRGLLDPLTLVQWGAAKSILTGEWLLPGYDADGRLTQLYAYRHYGGRARLLATPGRPHGLFGLKALDRKKGEVFVCEGPWDGMALGEEKGACVLAVPGANVFREEWLSLFGGKAVSLLYDNDHPKRNENGTQQGLAGFHGMRRAAELLAPVAAAVCYLDWGKGGYDPKLPDGYDVRDWLRVGGEDRRGALDRLLERVKSVPEEWLAAGRKRFSGKPDLLEPLPCSDWRTLTNAWRTSGMKWIEGLDHAMGCMLATILSTPMRGDQLWIKVVGPPSCGKTVLCEALSVARKYIYPKDTLTGLMSGYQLDKEGTQNLSLVERLRNMTLVIQDGDTILQLPNLVQILSQLRAFYGRNLRSQYGNRMSTDHENINTTVILCGTESLRSLDSSELGERLLDVVVVRKMDSELERDIARRKVYQAFNELDHVSDGKPESRDSPEMVEAKRLTAGYIEHLRVNGPDLLAAVELPEEAVDKCVAYATFIAFLRSRPSKRQAEETHRELIFRLSSQMTRLAKCLAVVLGRKSLDKAVMDRVRTVTLDTARGRTLRIVEELYKAGDAGRETMGIILATGQDETEERKLIRHLRRIEAIEKRPVTVRGVKQRPRYFLTDLMRETYRETVE